MMLGRKWRNTALLFILLLLCGACFAAERPIPGPAVVASVQAQNFVLATSILSPELIYPLGRLDFGVVDELLGQGLRILTGEATNAEAWRKLIPINDRIGILLDAQMPTANLELVDAIIEGLVEAGTRPENIVIFATNEQALFEAGIQVQKDAGKLKVVGADEEGFRSGTSRVLLDYCDAIINLARLRPDADFGMWGTLPNQLATVPQPERVRISNKPDTVGSIGIRAANATHIKLNILDALQPNYEPSQQLKSGLFWNCGTVLMGTDPVALDIAGMQILEEKRANLTPKLPLLSPTPITWLNAATETWRLGQSDPSQITIIQKIIKGR